jgi:hypothetical protein
MNEERRTPIRCYRKTDLARLYFPDSEIHAALTRLRRWIKNSKGLSEELASYELSPSRAFLRPKEVECIFRYFGEPETA